MLASCRGCVLCAAGTDSTPRLPPQAQPLQPLKRQKPQQLFATAGVSAEKGDMILKRTAKGQTVSLNCFMPLGWRLNQRGPRPHKAATPVTEL